MHVVALAQIAPWQLPVVVWQAAAPRLPLHLDWESVGAANWPTPYSEASLTSVAFAHEAEAPQVVPAAAALHAPAPLQPPA
jgi:hypothetical protein